MKSLKFILPIGLGLFLITGILTFNVRKEAEKKLNKEEMVAAVVNRQILSQQEALEKAQKEQRQAADDFYFKRDIGLK